ncbi:MAG: outer membrane beta-barrel protein [Microscillaceae bacterium]|nr:outer membrane beta-barrel protein [Microscillaceae bacterium]MDW8461337.1 outer membrane beta-barrel protein [Cytophagales bacterium]
MKKIFLITFSYFLLQKPLAFAQLAVGVKGGFTGTTGYFSTPAQPVAGTTAVIPEIKNKNGGMGFGGVAGIYAKYNLTENFFVMIETEYNHFLLKQKSTSRTDVNALVEVRSGLPISFQDNSIFANLSNRAEVTYQAIRVPIIFGSTFASKYRAFLGPSLIFPVASEITNFTQGNIEANSAVNFVGGNIPLTQSKANLMTKEGGILEVKRFTWGADLGVGYTFPDTNIDLDLRYAVNLGGITKNKDVKGFFGAFLITIGYRFWNSGGGSASDAPSK